MQSGIRTSSGTAGQPEAFRRNTGTRMAAPPMPNTPARNPDQRHRRRCSSQGEFDELLWDRGRPSCLEHSQVQNPQPGAPAWPPGDLAASEIREYPLSFCRHPCEVREGSMDLLSAMATFVRAADAGSLSAAARSLPSSLTSVSRQILGAGSSISGPASSCAPRASSHSPRAGFCTSAPKRSSARSGRSRRRCRATVTSHRGALESARRA